MGWTERKNSQKPRKEDKKCGKLLCIPEFW